MSINVCNNNSMSAITSLPSGVGGGSLVLIATQTASSSSTIDFTSGIDSTYKEYLFTFNNIHPATNNTQFQFQGSTDSGSNYNVTMTTTFFQAQHSEAGSGTALSYKTGADQAQGTSFQQLSADVGNENDECFSGKLRLFNPSSTTFVKHFISRCSTYAGIDYMVDTHAAGYFNTTSAIDAAQFKMSSGNIDAGDICLYGIL